MKKAFLFTFLLSFMVTTPSHAGSIFTVYGEGIESCGAWLEAVEDKKSGRGNGNYIVKTAWLRGFITGAGAAWSSANHSLRDVDQAGIDAFVSKFCRENPLDSIMAAAMKMADELKE